MNSIEKKHRTDNLIEKLKVSKEEFSKTIFELLSNRIDNPIARFNKLPQLGALNFIASDSEKSIELFEQASEKVKEQEPELAEIFQQMSSLVKDWSFEKAKEELKQEIFNPNLDKEEINNYLIIINRIIEEIFDEKIEYINTIKEFELKQDKLFTLFCDKEDIEKIDFADQEEKEAYKKLEEKHKWLNSNSITEILITIIAWMHLETNEKNNNIDQKTWLKLSEKWLMNIMKIFERYLIKKNTI